jgi:hypothetical protein
MQLEWQNLLLLKGWEWIERGMRRKRRRASEGRVGCGSVDFITNSDKY